MNAYTDTPAGEIVSLEQKVKTLSPLLRQEIREKAVSFTVYLAAGIVAGYINKKIGTEYGVLRSTLTGMAAITIADVGIYSGYKGQDLSIVLRDDIGALAGLAIGMTIGYHL